MEPEINNPKNAVIISVTAEHNKYDVYNRIIGVPETNKNHAMKYIGKGTKIYIHYNGIGISKIVEAVSIPYISHVRIPEWDDNQAEKYALRVDTRIILDIPNPITIADIIDMDIVNINSHTRLAYTYPRRSITPISITDSDFIFDMVMPESNRDVSNNTSQT